MQWQRAHTHANSQIADIFLIIFLITSFLKVNGNFNATIFRHFQPLFTKSPIQVQAEGMHISERLPEQPPSPLFMYYDDVYDLQHKTQNTGLQVPSIHNHKPQQMLLFSSSEVHMGYCLEMAIFMAMLKSH